MTEAREGTKPLLIPVAWAIMISVSLLSDALLHELAGGAPAWWGMAKIGLLAAFVAMTFLWRAVAPLRTYTPLVTLQSLALFVH